MYPLQYGTQKIEMGRGKDTDFESKKRAAIAQSKSNPFVMGQQLVVQELANQGAGEAIAMSRSPKYGNPNVTTAEVLDGRFGNTNFQNDAAGNQYLENPMNQTGFLAGGVSSTVEPQVDPQVMGEEAMMRVAMLQNGRQYGGLNDRRSLYGA